MSEGERERLMEALYKNAELCSWKKNDILLLDNVSVAHGRMDGRGGRKINFCVLETILGGSFFVTVYGVCVYIQYYM